MGKVGKLGKEGKFGKSWLKFELRLMSAIKVYRAKREEGRKGHKKKRKSGIVI